MTIPRILVMVVFCLVVSSALAQQPRIDSVTPSQGPIAGGTAVTLVGANLAGATVRLDAVTVTPIAQSGTEIDLVMPAHDNGYAVISLRVGNSLAYGEFLYVPPRLDEIPPGFVTTVAGVGTFVRDYGPAINATVFPAGLAFDGDGNLYIAEPGNNKISRVRLNGTIERVTAIGGLVPGDGGPAIDAQVSFPLAVTVDPAGNVYIPDQNYRIRKIDAQTGIITTIAGVGTQQYSGDGGPAIQAHLMWPTHIAADAADVFFIDFGASRIRRIHFAGGIISTFAGTGTQGFSGDGGLATQAQFNVGDADKGHLALDLAGNLYLADSENYRIRRIDRQSGVITTFYTLPQGYSASDAVGYVRSLAFDRAGNLYYGGSGRIVKLSPSGQFVTSWGNGTYALPVEGASATTTGLGLVTGLAVDGAGNIFYSNAAILRVQRIDIATNRIYTVAGISPAIIGENGPATAAVVQPAAMVTDSSNNLLFTDNSLRVRRLDLNGTLTTIAGTGSQVGQFPPAPAIQTVVGTAGIDLDGAGQIELAEWSNIGHIDSAGIIRDIVGKEGVCGYSGDGGLAMDATLCQAWDAVRDGQGNLIIADTNNNRIRRVDAGTGVISTIVGNGGPLNGYERYGNGSSCGDGGPAISACINTPFGVTVDSSNNLFISEKSGIRKVDASGTITTFAPIPNNSKLIFDRAGNLYASVRAGVFKLDAQGRQTWLAGESGSGTVAGFSGDGGPAIQAQFNIGGQASGIAIDGEGNLFVADNNRIRAIRYGAVIAEADSTVAASAGSPQMAVFGTTFPIALQIILKSPAGTLENGIRVDFAAPSSGASCTFAGGSTTFSTLTDVNGQASAKCTANSEQGSYSVTATPLTLGQSVSFSLANITAPPPGAPTIGTAVPGNAQATINFSVPLSDGGSPITGYTASCLPGPVSASRFASPITVTGLTNGVDYSCSVTASNLAGVSAASASASVMPLASIVFDLNAVQSRKTHGGAGTYDLPIDSTQPIGGLITIEPRTIGSGHTIVFQFNGPVILPGSVNVSPIGTATATSSGSEVLVTLTNVPDNQRTTISLANVNGSFNPPPVSIGFLIGDVNNSRSTNSSDISGVKARSGQSTTSGNFKFDVNVSGSVDSFDISAVKARAGLVLP